VVYGFKCHSRVIGPVAAWGPAVLRFLIGLILTLTAFVVPAAALVVELDDVAPDRIERQRAFVRGTLPPASAPEPGDVGNWLADQGVVEGAPILIRIFKAESELELWMQKGSTYVLQATFPICHWTGTLGPKLREGDKQSPEGFYTVGRRQMRHLGRWRNAFNIGYPNLHDKRLDRTGSYILMHGGCSSTGCFAMTQPVQQVIYRLAAAAQRRHQVGFQVHVFPFRMTEANMAAQADSPWIDFWRDLKIGYDTFEATQLPPRIAICGQRYVVGKATPGMRNDGQLRRIEPGKAEAAGFDTSRCDVPVVQPGELVATASAPGDGSADTGTHFTPSSARTVARIERKEPAGPPPASRAERTDYGWVERASRPGEIAGHRTASAKPDKRADERARLREKRRAHREALKNSYLRTLIGIWQ
jgi:murein L,D-transpeptidase YafK